MLHLEPVDLLIEQYKSVRQESLDVATRQQSVVQYGLASIGVAAAAGVAASDKNTVIAAVVLMGVIPLLVMFAIALVAMEGSRLARSRRFLRRLEHQVETLAGLVDQHPVLDWERERYRNAHERVDAYPFAFSAGMGFAIMFGPGVGGYLLVSEELWLALGLALAADLVVLCAFTVWASRTYRRLMSVAYDDGWRRAAPARDKRHPAANPPRPAIETDAE